MITLQVTYSWAMGHRLPEHEGRCQFLHGHNYEATYTIEGDDLDFCGRLIDFGEVKHDIRNMIDLAWDHGFLLDIADDEAKAALSLVKDQKIAFLNGPPTAENIAAALLGAVYPTITRAGCRVTKVRVRETKDCWAEASL